MLLDIRAEPCLVHKDYHFSHIISNGRKITGIIDFEWAIAGHNELDLIKSIWWMFEKHPQIEKPFIRGYKKYGHISKQFNKRKELYEVITLISMIAFSYEVKSSKWLNYNIKKLESMIGV